MPIVRSRMLVVELVRSGEHGWNRTVVRLSLPKQNAFSQARRSYEGDLCFCVSHTPSAHRPLGSITRARLRNYPEMSRLRRRTNGVPLREPVSIDEVPAQLASGRVEGLDVINRYCERREATEPILARSLRRTARLAKETFVHRPEA